MAHGYTLADITGLARAASSIARGGGILTVADRVDVAGHAMVVALLESADPVGTADLVRIGFRAVTAAVGDEFRHHGVDHHDGAERPSYAAFWRTAPAPTFDEVLIERIAVRQIMPMLTTRQKAVVRHVASFDAWPGNRELAEDFGMHPATYNVTLNDARERFRRWWHEGETPSAMWGRDRAGHRRAA